MKKIKLLTPLFSTIALSSLITIASCSCNKPVEDTSYIPYDQLDIVGEDVKGLKDESLDLSKYDKLIIPSNVREIRKEAFKDVLACSNIKTIVLKRDLRKICSSAFENALTINSIDVSDWTEETLKYIQIDADAFKNVSGIGSINFGSNFSDSQKEQIKSKLLASGLPLSWFAQSTDGHATSEKTESEVLNEFSIVRFNFPIAIDTENCQLIAGIQRTGGTDGTTVSVKNIEVAADGKSAKAEVGLYSSTELKSGDYVTYKIVLTNINKDTQEVQWQQELGDYKVTYTVNEEMPYSTILDEGEMNFELNDDSADFEYSFDGADWIKISSGENKVAVKAGDKLYFKGYNPDIAPENKLFIFKEITTPFIIGGKAMSLYNDGGAHSEVKMPQCAFVQLFKDCTGLIGVDPDFLDSQDLSTACYYEMFAGCTNLTNIPNLPATKLPYNAYSDMFKDCTKLTDADIELPATELSEYCYASMFSGCNNLKVGPTIKATSLVDSCFNAMFYGCTKLESIKLMYTGELSADNFFNWVSGVNSTGILYYNGTTTTHSKDSIPTNWTVEKF